MPSMTVAENIWIGREPLTRLGLVDHRALARRTAALLAGLEIDIDPDERICRSDDCRQADDRDCARRLLRVRHPHHGRAHVDACPSAKSISCSEIVADLKAPRERGHLHHPQNQRSVQNRRRGDGPSRRPESSARMPARRFDRDRLIAMMVGRELTQLFPKNNTPTDRVSLSVKDLSLNGTIRRRVVRRAGRRDPRHCRTRRLEAHRGRRDDVRPQAGDRPAKSSIDGVSGRHRFSADSRIESRDGVSHRRPEVERALLPSERSGKHGGRVARRPVRQHGLCQAAKPLARRAARWPTRCA